MTKKYILGISCYYHDSAAALISSGEILGAVQEERFTRIKHDPAFPENSIRYLLREFQIELSDIQAVIYYEKPFTTFERLLESHLNTAPLSYKSFLSSIPIWIRKKLFLQKDIERKLKRFSPVLPPIKYSEHHLSHASSAFYPSPFDEAAVLCLDGVGEWATTSAWVGKGNNLKPIWEIHYPHSLGLFYSAITAYLGFKVNSGEYKVMGLAPYGKPRYSELMFKHLLELHSDGSFSLNMKYFVYDRKLLMIDKEIEKLLGQPVRLSEGPLTQFHMDVAASLQLVLETVILHIVKHLRATTGQKHLCLAGGVALNCVANSKILKSDSGFSQIWIQPSAGDAGGALGAALAYDHLELKTPRNAQEWDSQKGSYLGPQFTAEEIESFLSKNQIPYQKVNQNELIQKTCQYLENKKIIGWFQGKMEFGPRALGHRSIIADARVTDLQKTMNLKIKFRESFRPFAPLVLEEDFKDIFDFDHKSPYMLLVANVKEKFRLPLPESEAQATGIDKLNYVRSHWPAITHVDYSARLQTVSRNNSPLLHDLLKEFKERNKSSVLVNTSFNVRGEPIVCSPQDAYTCFRRTDIDVLIMGNYLISKEMKLPDFNDMDWRTKFELD